MQAYTYRCVTNYIHREMYTALKCSHVHNIIVNVQLLKACMHVFVREVLSMGIRLKIWILNDTD